MTWPDALLLFVAGIGAGLSGTIAGIASLFSYPALLATGLAPVPATVTNSVALVFSTVGSVLGSRPELRVQHRGRLARLVATTTAGGLAGGLLLKLTPAATFEAVVPLLIGLAALGVLAPRPRARTTATGDRAPGPTATTAPVVAGAIGAHPDADPAWLFPAAFAVAIYCGYFGAASGTLLLALYLLATADTFAGCNAVKNLTLGTANGAAAVLFAFSAPVHWISVLPLAAGTLIGGRLGPVVVRHAPVRPLRWAIALAGLGLAVRLGFQAYA